MSVEQKIEIERKRNATKRDNDEKKREKNTSRILFFHPSPSGPIELDLR